MDRPKILLLKDEATSLDSINKLLAAEPGLSPVYNAKGILLGMEREPGALMEMLRRNGLDPDEMGPK